MRFSRCVVGLALLVLALAAQAALNWRSPANLAVVGAKDGIENEVIITALGQPGGLFYPGEAATATLAIPEKPAAPLDGASLVLTGIHNHITSPGEVGYVVVNEAPRVYRTEVPEARVALERFPAAQGQATVTLPLPVHYGVYAVTLERKDGTRTLLGTIARVHKPTPRKSGIPQIMSEFNFDNFRLRGAERYNAIAAAYARMGVNLVRIEIHWAQEKKDGPYGFPNIDPLMEALEQHNIKLVDTMGIHPEWSRPFGFGGICEEQYDPEFGKWVKAFTERYWKGGKAGLWGIEFYNEPWEPRGISGWNNDNVRYRQLLTIIHDNAKAVTPGIKIMGTSSVMNTEDKLISDGSPARVKANLDILTDHYVTPRASYGGRLAESLGVISGETETWGCSSEVMFPQFLTQFLACGNRFINPATGDMVMEVQNAGKGQLLMPKTTVAAISTWNALMADRVFTRIAFTKHLPWLYQFGPDNDAQCVLYGKLQPIASGNPRDVTWAQAAAGPEGTLVLTDPRRALVVLDAAGNPVKPEKGAYRLPMSTTSFYLSSKRGAKYVIERVQQGKLDGLRHVEIIPGTVAALPGTLPVTVHNLYNVPLAGQLTVTSLLDNAPLGTPQPVKLAAGETTTLQVPVAAMPAGGLPLQFTVTAPGVAEGWQEVIQCTGIARKALALDDAAAWAALRPVPVLRPQGKDAVNDIVKAWLPFIKRSDEMIPAKHGEVRLAWDENNLYLQAVADAGQLQPKQRLATWDEEQYFYSAKDDAVCEALRQFEKFVIASPRSWVKEEVQAYEKLKSDPGWPAFQQYLLDHPEAREMATTLTGRTFYEWKRRNPQITLASATHVYKKNFAPDLPFSGDTFQFAFDMDPAEQRMTRTHDLTYPVAVLPFNYQCVPDSDYEFSLYQCTDNQPELWCLLAPGVPRSHYYPRAPRGAKNQHAVAEARTSVSHANGQTTYRIALPWKTLGVEKPMAGMNFGFTFRFNDSKGGPIFFGDAQAATKHNGLTLHPYWEDKPSCSIRWTLQP